MTLFNHYELTDFFFIDLFQSLLGPSADKVNRLNVNLENAEKRLKTIEGTYYVRFQKDSSFLTQTGAVWFARKDIESARYYATGGREGYAVSDRVQDDAGLNRFDPRVKKLLQEITDVESKVKEMEKAKGYEFVAVRDNNIIYKDTETGKELSAKESSQI
ncbi:hypothetical protein [Xanthocytophaga agilis]|uniref:Uncharacterized protein n=1 Tax=Xanthocytophaga agilis TaxID=3048010 RepID=A0AAE3R7W1_9BACT|nr:hypothetical protein [Xanthocytophaga agilis]MDJ1505296.1 hypothetical protein [Xanthocytophaga agilis]